MIPILLSVLCYDLWFYFSHILLHNNHFYRKIHCIHHRKMFPRALDTYEGHWIEGPLQSLGTFAPFFFLTYTPWEILVILCILNLRGMMRHDDRFVWLIGNHHLLHHQYPQWNYGEFWLDWLFGTLYPNRDEAVRGLLYM